MLKTENLTFSINNQCLIKDISLQFKPGILYGILGPNGSGKSTLLKNLTGIWKPTSGRVKWNGEDLLIKQREEISRTITLVPQSPQIHFDFPVIDMVAMGRYPYGSNYHTQSQSQIEDALKTVDAWHLRERSMLCLSLGEAKRVYIARALITESPILLLDEPSASLDIKHQLEVWELLLKLSRKGKTVIVTNHDLVATKRYCDEIAVLNHGRCITHGKHEDIFSESLLWEVFGVKEATGISEKSYSL